jgi:hypothetical protein
LLYTAPKIFNWLPRHGFKDDADFARFEDLAGKNTQVFGLPPPRRTKPLKIPINR